MGFNINDFLNAESKKNLKSDWKPVKVSVRKLRPAPDKTNFRFELFSKDGSQLLFYRVDRVTAVPRNQTGKGYR